MNREDLIDKLSEMIREAMSPDCAVREPVELVLIQGYTEAQWQEIIDGKYLCEFSGSGNEAIGHLEELKGDLFPFQQYNGSDWSNCRPAPLKGVLRPIFVEPVGDGAMCHFFDEDGAYLDCTNWGKSAYHQGVRATSYIEV
jgi:hypothetical protein